MPAPILSLLKKQNISNIFIGIDFGTSYTKVSYSYAPTQIPQIETIKWDNDFFKQTVLYVKDDRLYFDKPSEDAKEVKYFKYSIIEEKLKNNTEKTVNKFEELCCIYFLAQIIERSLQKIQKNLKITNFDKVKISVNMGVPLENFYEEENKNNKGLYQDLLEAAILLAGGAYIKVTLPVNQVLISNLDSVYTEILQKEAFLKWTANVFPELASELLLYHQSKFVGEGVYAIIDIGGGTVDMAVFQKHKLTKNMHTMACLSQKVLPYGIEILRLSKDKNAVSKKEFQTSFCAMLIFSKKCENVNFDSQSKLDVFFLGGGANDSWYKNAIKEIEHLIEPANIPKLNFESLDAFIKDEEKLVEKNQRLIISQMMAQHDADITKVQGFPNFFENALKNELPEAKKSFDEILAELYDKYRG